MDAKVETSPFLPGTNVQYAWDSTSLGDFKRCPRLYYYRMIEGWQEKDESVHLRFGIEYHHALQDYEECRANGQNHDDSVNTVVYNLLRRISDWNPDRETKAGKNKNAETLLRTVIWYLDEHKNDEAKTLIWKDGTPAVEQSFRFELTWGPEAERNERGHLLPEQPYVLCGHLDKIVVYQGQRFVMDHKTTTWYLTSHYFDRYEPDNQMTLYALASKVVLHQDHPVRGVIIDAARIEPEKSSFARGITYRVADQLAEWITDLKWHLAAAERCAREGYWPQNDTACDKYGGCKFREICSKSPKVRDRFLEGNFIRQSEEEKWNPLRTR
jgi:hypothetical protein